MTPQDESAPKGAPGGLAAKPDTRRDSTPAHDVYMRYTLAARLRWLERHEHWWARELRWHRERFGPDCSCDACTWEPGAVA